MQKVCILGLMLCAGIINCSQKAKNGGAQAAGHYQRLREEKPKPKATRAFEHAVVRMIARRRLEKINQLKQQAAAPDGQKATLVAQLQLYKNGYDQQRQNIESMIASAERLQKAFDTKEKQLIELLKQQRLQEEALLQKLKKAEVDNERAKKEAQEDRVRIIREMERRAEEKEKENKKATALNVTLKQLIATLGQEIRTLKTQETPAHNLKAAAK